MLSKNEKIIKVKAPKSGSERLELVLDPNWILTPDDFDDRNDREDDNSHPDIAHSASNHSNHSASTAETDNRSGSRVNRTFSLESDGSVSRTDFENDVYREMERRGDLYEGEEDYYSMDNQNENRLEDHDDNAYYNDLEKHVSTLQNSLNDESERFDGSGNTADNVVDSYFKESDANAISLRESSDYVDQDSDLQYYVNNGACVIKDAVVNDEILNNDSVDLDGPDDELDPQEHQMSSTTSTDFDDEYHEMPSAVSKDFDDDRTGINLEYDQPVEHGNRGANKPLPRRGVSFDEDFLSSSESNKGPDARRTPLRRMLSDDTSVSSVGYRVVTTTSKEKMAPVQIRERTTSPSILRQPKYTSNISVSSHGNVIDQAQSPKHINTGRKKFMNERRMNETVIPPSSNSVFSSQSAKRETVRGEGRASSPTDDSITSPSGVSSDHSHGSNSAVGQLVRTRQKTARNETFLTEPPTQQRQQYEQQQGPQLQPPNPRQQTNDPQPRPQIGVPAPGVSWGQQTVPSIARSHSGLSGYSEGVRSTAALDGYVEEEPKRRRFFLPRPKKPTRPNTSTVNEISRLSKKIRFMPKLFGRKKKTVIVAEEERRDNLSTMRHPMSPGDPNPELSLQANDRDPPIPSVLYRRKSSQRIRSPTDASERDNVSVASEPSASSHHSSRSRNSQQSNFSHALSRSPSPCQQQPPPSFNDDNKNVLDKSPSGLDDNPWAKSVPNDTASVRSGSQEASSNIDIAPNDSLLTVTQIASVPNNHDENQKNDPAETANLPNDSIPNTNPPDGSYNLDGSGMPAFKWWTWSQPDDKSEQGRESRYCALMCVFPPSTE
eukprot:CCRYP_018524-RA/>CCRYP_018524-RA protein AED:0.30 eAED:0.30 QI:0/-1/0/1/-1/1/1/0/832